MQAHWIILAAGLLAMAAFIGFKIPKPEEQEPEKKYMTADDLERLMAMTGGRIPRAG